MMYANVLNDLVLDIRTAMELFKHLKESFLATSTISLK